MKIEPWIFYLMVVINSWAVFSEPYILTMDGASHVLNAQMINTLLFDPDSTLHQYFIINQQFTPNWFGHILLLILQFFSEGILAEKVLFVIYCSGTPVLARLWVKSHGRFNLFLPYFVFILVHNQLLYLGFYNFSLALPLAFLSLTHHQKHVYLKTRKQQIIQFLLLTLLLFSHIFVLAITLFLHGLILLDSDIRAKETLKSWVSSIMSFVLVALPHGLYIVYYALFGSPINSDQRYTTEILNSRLLDVNILKIYSGVHPWYPFSHNREAYWILLGLGLILGIGFTIYRKRRNWLNVWLLAPLLLLAAYYVVPNARYYITNRLLLFFFLSLAIFISSIQWRSWAYMLVIPLFFYIQRESQFSFLHEHKNHTELITNIVEAGKHLEDDAVVLGFTYSNYWLLTENAMSYLALDRPIVLLNNYEAYTGYFPVAYQADIQGSPLLGKAKRKEEIPYVLQRSTGAEVIPYLFFLKQHVSEAFEEHRADVLSNGYMLVFENKHALIFKYEAAD